MTEQTQPTDAELAALRSEFGITSNGRGIKEFTQVRAFARAVLAKWGTPAGAGDLENPHAALQKAWAPGHKWEWTKPGEGRWWHHNGEPEWDPDWQYRLAAATPQPTQAQAGAVPFNKAQRTNLFNNRDLASEKNMGVKLTLAEWHRIVQYIEAAHGIKGADHVS